MTQGSGSISYRELFEDLRLRTSRAVVNQTGVRSRQLRDFLTQIYAAEPGSAQSLLASPVFEATFGWQSAGKTLEQLVDAGLLSRELVDAMDKPPSEDAREFSFPRNRRPFTHQLRSWELLLDAKPRSVLVSSGTGSGKTECFLVPILEDLARERRKSGRVSGVRSIFLYPLNALINSQRDRLSAWTGRFKGDIRFCLYNGETRDSVPEREQREHPEEQLSRRALRDDPAPILVTNSTMLEYMLVRNLDNPIIEKSQGLLRWIVLDEAHSYLGSSAAELTLLLRRVLYRFGVNPAEVRFVATSATIGTGENADQELKRFLQSVSGASPDRIHVLRGSRDIPPLPASEAGESMDIAAWQDLPPDWLYRALVRSGPARRLRDALSSKAMPLNQLKEALGKDVSEKTTLALLDLGGKAREGEIRFLPTRAHAFLRSASGLWCCSDQYCNGRSGPLDDPDWSFGAVFTEKRDFCQFCSAPVYEAVSCTDCGEIYLNAVDQFKMGRHSVVPKLIQENQDEFQLELDPEAAIPEDDEQEVELPDNELGEPVLLAGKLDGDLDPGFDVETLGISRASHFVDSAGPIQVNVVHATRGMRCCLRCGNKEKNKDEFRPVRIGAPFLLSTLTPLMLDNTPSADAESGQLHRGQRLLTFSDSRQGSARMSVRLQQESERNHVRSILYHGLARARKEHIAQPGKIESLEKVVEALEKSAAASPELRSLLEEKQSELDRARGEGTRSGVLSWEEATNEIAHSPDFVPMHAAFRSLTGLSESKEEFASYCLFREFMRRPKRMNSAETLGLMSVTYPVLLKKAENSIPGVWGQLIGGSKEEWVSLAKLVLDFHMRSGTSIDLPEKYLRWMGIRVRQTYMQGPDFDQNLQQGQRNWPRVWKTGHAPRLARLVSIAYELDLDSPTTRDWINEVFRHLWEVLRSGFRGYGSGYLIDLEKQAALSEVRQAWVCPYTQRVLDTTLRGYSPYVPADGHSEKSVPIVLPQLPHPYWRDDAGRDKPAGEIRQWLENDSHIASGRNAGTWTTLNDRVASFDRYFEVAEHSAQIPGDLLRYREKRFKAGDLNVLSCSTTMEMGVDIGGLSAVLMNNAPPHPANYLQRAGRAGRRSEGTSVAVTLCKNTPHGNAIFRNPVWPFETRLSAPRVGLDSRRLVQRHVNALCLGEFLRGADVHRLLAGWFFLDESSGATAAGRFRDWCLQDDIELGRVVSGLRSLVRGSALETAPVSALLSGVVDALDQAEGGWRAEVDAMLEDERALLSQGANANSAGVRAIGFQLRRKKDEYLLRELVLRGFLPGYGFPTHVASLLTMTIDDLPKKEVRSQSEDGDRAVNLREDNLAFRAGSPSRDLQTALREYAPGAEVVVNGKVFQSGGVTLNWHLPPGTTDIPEIQSLRVAWHCRQCGATGSSHRLEPRCPVCGSPEPLSANAFLEPAGFAVDIRYRPHNDVSAPLYIPVREPWVSCATAEWTNLPDATIGRFRYSNEGHLFYSSAGLGNEGYALCLRCGRAAQEGSSDSPLAEHTRLRGGKDASGGSRCEGNDQSWAIRRRLWLGTSQQTDVFELQLSQAVSQEAALSLAAALRSGLASSLGIEEAELGFSTAQSRLPNGTRTYSIFLIDRANGGAGYVVNLPSRLTEVVEHARRMLNCPEDCDRVCHACLLGPETQYQVDLLDRHAALSLLDEKLLAGIRLPDEARFFDAHTHVTTTTLWRAIRQAVLSDAAAEVSIWFDGAADTWNPSDFPLYRDLLHWASEDRKVSLYLNPASWQGLHSNGKHVLASLIESSRDLISVSTGAPPLTPMTGGKVAAAIRSGEVTRAWGVSTPVRLAFDATWGQVGPGQFSVWTNGSPLPIPPASTPLDPSALRPAPEAGLKEIRVSRELDGAVATFGSRFWSLLTSEVPELSRQLAYGGKIATLGYSDRYLRSPLPILLLRSVLLSLPDFNQLVDSNTRLQIHTRSLAREASDSQYGINANWPPGAEPTRRDFLSLILDAPLKGGSSWPGKLVLTDSDQSVPHWRELSIAWSHGRIWSVKLDQGFGFWLPTSSTRFPIERDARAQATVAVQQEEHVKVSGGRSGGTTILYGGPVR